MWKINFLKLNISIYYYLRASNVTIRILPDRTILIVTFFYPKKGFQSGSRKMSLSANQNFQTG